jgi:hypothetical protein
MVSLSDSIEMIGMVNRPMGFLSFLPIPIDTERLLHVHLHKVE